MLGPDAICLLAALPSIGQALPLAYVGLGPGQELIPYFWALLAFVGTAVVAVIQWPILKLRRALARMWSGRSARVADEPTRSPLDAGQNQSPKP